MTVSTILILFLIGICAGVLSGLVGIGGGIIMVPMFVALLGLSQHQSQGLSLAVMLPPVTSIAVYNYYKAGGEVDWRLAIITSLFFVVGGYIGSKFALQIDQKTLKKIFGGLLLIVAFKFIFGK
ncbi:MAG: sulfite exporter TauE/SafE family protein [Flavobacteriaceae bacterium]|nr:sulfite exporter TauE/SafE family protein [Flavobacteriaceae bacterium]